MSKHRQTLGRRVACPAFGPLFISTFPSTAAGAVQALRPLFFGTALMLFLIFEPRGLAHRWYLLKAAWRLRPFSH